MSPQMEGSGLHATARSAQRTMSWLPEPEGADLVQRYGVPYPDFGVAVDADAAAAIADGIGYPVVLKAVSDVIVHKSDIGAVVTCVKDEEALRVGFREIASRVSQHLPSASLQAILVAAEVPPGLEVIVGGRRDSVFGPVVAVGLGGVYVELDKEVALRLAPLSPHDAAEAIRGTRLDALLKGFRGGSPLDRGALERLIVDAAQMLVSEQSLIEFDLNPVRVFKVGALALDVRIGVNSHGQAFSVPAM